MNQDQFNNPPKEYRGLPFWSWNGKLEKEELLRQLPVLKEMGMNGAFMHSRTGLATEYLGEEWFDLIRTCAKEGESLGMEMWLYDEDRWPSGTAGGMVTQCQEYRMKFLRCSIMSKEAFQWTNEMIAVFTAQVENLTLHTYERINRDFNLDKYCGMLLVFTIEETEPSSFYNGFTYVDTMSREATEKFIELTHDKYKRSCGDQFGTSIKGIFTDEPHRGPVMNNFSITNHDPEWLVPWTENIFDEYKKVFGYDLVPRLPELFYYYKGEMISPVKWSYVEIMQRLFIDNFAVPIKKWCIDNNLIFTGHILHEDSLTAQTAMSGSVMRFYEHMEYPGIDVLTKDNKNYWVAKQVSSVARQMNQKFILSELYGCTGWETDFEAHRNIGLWQALYGINLRCHHLAWYTMEGESKRDYPASIFQQSGWYKEYNFIETYFARIGYVMSQGNPVCDVLVVNPVESVWAQIHPGWCKWLGATTKNIQSLEKKYSNTFYMLQNNHVDFDYGDEDMLYRHANIIKQGEKSLLQLGNAVYRTVVIAGMDTIRSSTLNLLELFAKAGGNVIFTGELPGYVDAVPSDKVSKLSETCTHVPFEEAALIAACKQNVVVEISCKQVFVQVRKDEDTYYILMVNINRENRQEDVRITFHSLGYVEEWDCTDGRMYEADQNMVVTFEKGAEKLFVISEKKHDCIVRTNTQEVNSIPVEESFDYELNEPNVCVLDLAKLSIDDSPWSEQDEILQLDRRIRDTYHLAYRGGEMVQPWFKAKGTPVIYGNVKLRYEFFVEAVPQDNIYLVLETPQRYKISINGTPVTLDICENWIDCCFKKARLSGGVLQVGANNIELECEFTEEINIESIYLLGNFGVQVTGSVKCITSLPDKINTGCSTQQGLPFYSGSVAYIIKQQIELQSEERALLTFDELNGALYKVNGKVLAFAPYEVDVTEYVRQHTPITVEVILTRRNTFGPLHVVPTIQEGYGPDTFLATGENFSMGYSLVSSGFCNGARVRIVK